MATPGISVRSNYDNPVSSAPSHDVVREIAHTSFPSTSSAAVPLRSRNQHQDRIFFSDFSTWDRWHPALTHYRE